MGFPVVGEGINSSSYVSQETQIDFFVDEIVNESQWDIRQHLIESLLDSVFAKTPSTQERFFESIFQNNLDKEVFDIAIYRFRSEDVNILYLITLFANRPEGYYSATMLKIALELLNSPSVSPYFKEHIFDEVTRFQNSIYLVHFYLNCFKETSSGNFLDLFKACFDGLDGSFQSYLIKDLLNAALYTPESYLLVPVRYLLWKGDFASVINCEWFLYAIGFTRYDRSIFDREFHIILMHFKNMTSTQKSQFIKTVYKLLDQNVGNMGIPGSLFFSLVLIAGGDGRGLPLFKKVFHDLSRGEITYFLDVFFNFLISSGLSFGDDVITAELIEFIINEFHFDKNLFYGLDTKRKSIKIISFLENAVSDFNPGLAPQET